MGLQDDRKWVHTRSRACVLIVQEHRPVMTVTQRFCMNFVVGKLVASAGVIRVRRSLSTRLATWVTCILLLYKWKLRLSNLVLPILKQSGGCDVGVYQGSIVLRLSPARQLTFRLSSTSPLSPHMDAFFVISTPIIASPESETSSSSEFDETIVDTDSFGYIGWHSGCVIS